MTKSKWQAVEVTANPTAREAVEYGLMEAGALGTETLESGAQARVIGYFESAVDDVNIAAALANSWQTEAKCRGYLAIGVERVSLSGRAGVVQYSLSRAASVQSGCRGLCSLG